jgi:hypothetical protein
VTLSIAIYGFGSAFDNVAEPGDVDLLIIHPEIDHSHCRFAISCKRLLKERIPKADVTVLSASEEGYFQFIKTARAIHFGAVRESHIEADLAVLLVEMSERSSPK